MEPTDEQIVGKVQDGDTEAFGVLMSRYEKKILRYGRKFLQDTEDIKDLVQEVFVKTYMNIRSFDTSKRFSPWIYRIAHNEFVNALKKNRFKFFPFFDFDKDVLFPHPIAEETADTEAEGRINKELLDKCLHELDAKYQEVLILSYYEELGYQEIAEVLQIPMSTVGVRLRRAKAQLKKIYEHTYGTQA